MWYSPHAQVTYNRIFNFVVGVRGGGKTFNLIRFCIDQYKKYGHEFIYLRRRQVHLDDACSGTEADDLFADIRNKDYFKEHKLKVKGDKAGGYNFYFDDKIMGYGKALSTSSGRRSSSKPKVKYVIYDEFLIDDSIGTNERYLNHGEEMFIFNNFYETIARGRDIQCFFIGNAFSMVNPYFLALDIRIHSPEDNKIYKGKTWTCIFWRDKTFIEERKSTQFYEATKNTKFSEHAFDNTFYLDKNDFIKKRSKNSEHQFSMVYLNRTYGVWVDWDKGEYYVSSKGANTSRDKTISLSMSDNKPNNVNIRRYRNLPFIKMFRMAVDNNSVYFDSQEAYNMMNEVVYLLKTIT